MGCHGAVKLEFGSCTLVMASEMCVAHTLGCLVHAGEFVRVKQLRPGASYIIHVTSMRTRRARGTRARAPRSFVVGAPSFTILIMYGNSSLTELMS